MAHKLEKFYSSFGGVDTRSNKLLMDPRTFRNGSKNFRYNFQDEIQNANGFQHKSEDTPVSFVDIFEYKFRDPNSGESISQVLAVGVDGNLYRKVAHYLKWSAVGAGTSYSFYYDEVADTFKLSVNGISSVDVSQTMTLDQLKTALNLLAGVTVDIVDQDGASVASSHLAYLLDVRIEDTFNLNASWGWEVVPHPNIKSTTGTNGALSTYTVVATPFQTTVKAQDPITYPEIAAGYEGISSVNLNNCIYITDGGFPMKYDGKTVYRAGMPKVLRNYATTGITISAASTPAGLNSLPSGSYKYLFRFGFTDYQGATYYGDFVDDDSVSITPIASGNVYQITTKGIYYGQDFPTYCAKVNGDQSVGFTGAGMVLTVHTGHNILPGMIVRQLTSTVPIATRSTANTFINFYAKVTAVTETTITLASTVSSAGDSTYVSNFKNGEILQAYFVESAFEGKRPSGVSTSIAPAGAFLQIFRSKIDATTGPYYHIWDMPVPHTQGDTFSIYDSRADSGLTILFSDADPGGELPRACKYLASWLDQLVQAGRPADPTLKDARYPSVSDPSTATLYSQPAYDLTAFYTEALLCDFQSVYWTDPLAPEGFPLDGLHEYLINTKFNDNIKGIAQNKDSLFALKERSTGILAGDIGTNDLVLEILEDDIGCSSHKSIKEVKGALVWLDKDKGFYSCVAGRLPEHIGYPISDYQQINAQKLDYSTACAVDARNIDMYICAVGTTWFVYDYSETAGGGYRKCWYIWERFDAHSMIYTADDELILLGTKCWKLKNTNTRFDMTDHTDAIEMDARCAWLNFGAPTIDKRFERVWVNSIQGGFTVAVKQYANYLEPEVGSISLTPIEGSKLTVKDEIKCAIPKLSAISIGFSNSQKNKLVRIQGFELEWSPDFDTQEPRR